jgi:hypothetical protein
MKSPAPRISAFHDLENRLRHDWQEFTAVWQETKTQWKDKRRQEFEDRQLRELPTVLTRCQAELNQYREVLRRAMQALEDEDSE